MEISAGNGFAIVDMRALIYLACIRRPIGTNTTVIKTIRSTERNWVLQSGLKFKVVVRANYYRANLFKMQTKNSSAPILSSIMYTGYKSYREILYTK